MLKKNKEGLYYVSEATGKMYYLSKGTSINGDREYTDDICYIMDSGFTEDEYTRWINDDDTVSHFNEVFVNWFAGATHLEKEEYQKEYEKVVKEYVDEYESKKKYPFTEQGVKDFYDDSVDNAFEMLTKTGVAIDIDIKVENMEITIPSTADNYERLGVFLKECQEDTVSIRNEDRKENNMKTNQNNYEVKKLIVSSCYSGVFDNIFILLINEDVDGWNAMQFTSWLYETAKKFQDLNVNGNCSKDIFFALYDKTEVNMMKDPDIKYGTCLKDCFMDYKNVKYYRIKMTEDCSLEEIIPKTHMMEKRILKTLESYHFINHEVLKEVEVKDLEEQIEYMKRKIKEV